MPESGLYSDRLKVMAYQKGDFIVNDRSLLPSNCSRGMNSLNREQLNQLSKEIFVQLYLQMSVATLPANTGEL